MTVWPVRLFVGGIWLLLTLGMLAYVYHFGSNVPFFDDWRIVPYIAGDQPVTLEWLWSQHGDHRVPLTRLLLLALGKLCGYDFRCGMVFDVLALSATSLVLIAVSTWLRGRLSFADAFFPLVLITPGQWETYLWCWIAALTLPIVLALLVLAIIVRWGLRPPAWATFGAGLLILALPLADSAGLAFVPALMLWLVTAGVWAWRTKPLPPLAERVLPLVFAVAAAGLLIFYYIGYKRVDEGELHPSVPAVLRTTIEFLSMGIGHASVLIWPVSALIVLGFLGSAVYVLGRTWREQPNDRSRVAALAFFFAGAACLALALAWGRAGEGANAGFKSRYVVLAIPVPCAVFLSWGVWRGAERKVVQSALCLVMLLLVPFNVKTALDSAEQFRPRMAAFEKDLADGKPASYLAERHTNSLHAWPPAAPDRKFIHERLLMLQHAGIGPYRNMAPDMPFHEVALAVEPGGAHGSEARFSLPEPQSLLAIRLRCTFGAGQDAGDLAVYVKAPGEEEVRVAEVVAVPPNLLRPDDEQPLLAYVNRRIDQVRFASADGRAFTLTEVVLLVADGQKGE